MKRCSVCGSKFGLTRHYYDLKSFCSAKCLANYKGRWERLRDHLRSTLLSPEGELEMMLYIYFATLYPVPWPYLSVWPTVRTLRRLPDRATATQ